MLVSVSNQMARIVACCTYLFFFLFSLCAKRLHIFDFIRPFIIVTLLSLLSGDCSIIFLFQNLVLLQ